MTGVQTCALPIFILEKRTVGDLVRDIQKFSPERKKALDVILNDMQFSTMIGHYNADEK